MISVTAVPRATSDFLLLTSPFPRSLLLRLRVRCGGGACDGRSPRYSKTGAERYDNSCRPTGDCDHGLRKGALRVSDSPSGFNTVTVDSEVTRATATSGTLRPIPIPMSSFASDCPFVHSYIFVLRTAYSPVAKPCNMRPGIRMGRYSP